MTGHPSAEERSLGRLQARILRLRINRPTRGTVVHLLPAAGEEVTGCCRRSVFELADIDRLEELPSVTTCTVAPPTADGEPEWWDR